MSEGGSRSAGGTWGPDRRSCSGGSRLRGHAWLLLLILLVVAVGIPGAPKPAPMPHRVVVQDAMLLSPDGIGGAVGKWVLLPDAERNSHEFHLVDRSQGLLVQSFAPAEHGALSEDGRFVSTSSKLGTLVHRIGDEQPLLHLPSVWGKTALSRDGRLLAILALDPARSMSFQTATLRVFDVAGGEQLHFLETELKVSIGLEFRSGKVVGWGYGGSPDAVRAHGFEYSVALHLATGEAEIDEGEEEWDIDPWSELTPPLLSLEAIQRLNAQLVAGDERTAGGGRSQPYGFVLRDGGLDCAIAQSRRLSGQRCFLSCAAVLRVSPTGDISIGDTAAISDSYGGPTLWQLPELDDHLYWARVDSLSGEFVINDLLGREWRLLLPTRGAPIDVTEDGIVMRMASDTGSALALMQWDGELRELVRTEEAWISDYNAAHDLLLQMRQLDLRPVHQNRVPDHFVTDVEGRIVWDGASCNLAAWSSDGRHLLGSTRDNRVVIWEAGRREILNVRALTPPRHELARSEPQAWQTRQILPIRSGGWLLRTSHGHFGIVAPPTDVGGEMPVTWFDAGHWPQSPTQATAGDEALIVTGRECVVAFSLQAGELGRPLFRSNLPEDYNRSFTGACLLPGTRGLAVKHPHQANIALVSTEDWQTKVIIHPILTDGEFGWIAHTPDGYWDATDNVADRVTVFTGTDLSDEPEARRQPELIRMRLAALFRSETINGHDDGQP